MKNELKNGKLKTKKREEFIWCMCVIHTRNMCAFNIEEKCCNDGDDDNKWNKKWTKKHKTEKHYTKEAFTTNNFKLSFESIGKLFISIQFVIYQYKSWILLIIGSKKSAKVKDSNSHYTPTIPLHTHNHWSIMDKENGSGGGSSKHKNSNNSNRQPTIDVNDPSSLLNAASLFGESFSTPAPLY